jgi:hypothetical protein
LREEDKNLFVVKRPACAFSRLNSVLTATPLRTTVYYTPETAAGYRLYFPILSQYLHFKMGVPEIYISIFEGYSYTLPISAA